MIQTTKHIKYMNHFEIYEALKEKKKRFATFIHLGKNMLEIILSKFNSDG